MLAGESAATCVRKRAADDAHPTPTKRARTGSSPPGSAGGGHRASPLGDGVAHVDGTQSSPLEFEDGCAAVRMHAAGCDIAGAADFERRLRVCATRWLRATLDAGAPPMRAELAKDSKAGARRVPRYPLLARLDLGDAAQRGALQQILDRVNLADDAMFATVFDASARKAWCAVQARASGAAQLTAAHGNDLAALVRWGLDGAANAQGQPHLGWRLSGFGIFTNLHGLDWPLRVGLPAMQRALAGVSDVRGLPTVIFKPPHGGELKVHNDSGSWAQLFALTEKYSSVRAWVDGEGVQALMHVRGARLHEKGRTCLLGPMSVKRFRALLMLVHPDHPHPDMPIPDVGSTTVEPGAVSAANAAGADASVASQHPKFGAKWVESGGPVFYKWDSPKALAVANRVLSYCETPPPVSAAPSKRTVALAALRPEDRRWLASVEQVTGGKERLGSIGGDHPLERLCMRPICPPATGASGGAAGGGGVADDAAGVYTAVWPVGFIHCAEKTTDAARLTLCPAICRPVGGHDTELLQRSARRLDALAKRDFAWLAQDRQPYAGGAVHRHPECEAGLLEHFGELYLKNDAAEIATAQRHILPAAEHGGSEPESAAAAPVVDVDSEWAAAEAAWEEVCAKADASGGSPDNAVDRSTPAAAAAAAAAAALPAEQLTQ